jgi:hypothetical protein
MSEDTNIFEAVIEALDPVIAGILDVIPFPINAAIAFLWGGITEVIVEVLFG